MNRLIQQITTRIEYDINYDICITILTIIITNPRQQITNVFQTTCMNAMKEKSDSMSLENKMILLCLSISILNIGTEGS